MPAPADRGDAPRGEQHQVTTMSEQDQAARAARLRQQAEQRLIVQATMQAKRAGKLPGRTSSTGSEVVTALGVVAVVIGLLVLAFRYGH